MTTLTRSLTLNGITASITINNNGTCPELIDWSLNITDTDKNNASTNGAYAITKPVAKQEEPVAKQEEPVAKSEEPVAKQEEPVAKPSITTQKFDSKQRDIYVARIREMVEDCNTAVGKENRRIYACIIFNYLLKDALEFIKHYTKFNKTLINKCYELKEEASDCVPFITLANKLLTALSVPLEKPVVKSVAKSEEKPEVKSEEKPIESTTNDLILQEANEEARTAMMKSIFVKKRLMFNDTIMPRYHEWEKTFKPAKPANRFQKMSEFAKTLSAK
jgi:hypothetical protein